MPRFLDPRIGNDLSRAVPAIQRETGAIWRAATKFLAIARGERPRPPTFEEHYTATDILSREIRHYTAALFQPGMPYAQAESAREPDRGGGFQRQPRRDALSDRPPRRSARPSRAAAGSWSMPPRPGRRRAARDHLGRLGEQPTGRSVPRSGCRHRWRCASAACKPGAELPPVERGAILALLGSAERAFVLIERIDAERRSVARVVPRMPRRRRARARRPRPGRACAGVTRRRRIACRQGVTLGRCRRREPGVRAGAVLTSEPGAVGSRSPKIALPTRTWLAPNCTAISKSALMPMLSLASPLRAAILASSAKCGAGSSSSGGMPSGRRPAGRDRRGRRR